MEIVKTTQKIPRSRKVVLHLPESFKAGQVVELTISIKKASEDSVINTPKIKLNLAKWAEENAIEFEPEVQSTDVEGFTGRRF